MRRSTVCGFSHKATLRETISTMRPTTKTVWHNCTWWQGVQFYHLFYTQDKCIIILIYIHILCFLYDVLATTNQRHDKCTNDDKCIAVYCFIFVQIYPTAKLHIWHLHAMQGQWLFHFSHAAVAPLAGVGWLLHCLTLMRVEDNNTFPSW